MKKKLLFLALASFLVLGACEDSEQKDSEESKASETKKKDDSKKEEKQKDKAASKEEKTDEQKGEEKSEESNKEKESEATAEPVAGTTARIPVKLSATVDGDTAKFVYKGAVKTFRFLLIDTPETKHPRVGKQPFGQEASDRTAELLKQAKKIEVEFDVGEKKDKYDRYLTYVYVDGKLLNNILVREGLAKVAYVYVPNTRYLSDLEASQKQAKAEQIGIWSLGSAFEDESANNTGDNNNNDATVNDNNNAPAANDNNNAPATNDNNASNDTTGANNAVDNTQVPNENVQAPASSSESFANCTALREVYPNGVPSGHPAYEPRHDRDKDDFACEAN
ncbi:endonuclease YncB(thermonuclease family) [Staphylococcus auricularis]|uniref:thermonuclease family protein n=1 Tax=Staphylococcus auricularis TaxID=29379 RepID=UPI0019343FAC|nr:thermonuclease family protein [Staphylococcus auricularis]MBM0868183.1 DNA-binding protein [Staphylococcus auricularis]